MKIKIQSVHFDADVKLLDFIESKMNKLEQFYDSIIGAEVILKIDKAENSENKVADIKLLVPGIDLFSKRQAKSFEEAIDQASEALERQLKKRLGKEKK
ncbi:MAG: ribosome-associated translation inhibitor RaiA [Salinivirgaceae bacterium]|jgi:putative sigma-54 modulation protein